MQQHGLSSVGTQRRCAVVVLALLLAAGGGATAQGTAGAPTRWRGAQEILIGPRPAGQHRVTLRSQQVATYPDPLYYVWTDARGETLARGTLSPGAARVVRATSTARGAQRLRVDPGRNAFSLAIEGPWCVELSAERVLRTITRMRPLYFVVRRGTRRLPLKLDSDEASTLRFLGPEGQPIAEQSHEEFRALEFAIDVPPGLDGRPWSVEGRLDEDLSLFLPRGVLPYVAERPEWAAAGPKWGHAQGLVSFDERYVGRRELMAGGPPGAPVGVLKTGGLAVGLDATGRVATLKLDGQEQARGAPAPLTGLLVRDVAADGPLRPLPGRVRRTAAGLEQSHVDARRGLRLQARWSLRRGAVFVEGEVADTTGRDRALSVVLALPLRTQGRRWWDDMDTSRPLAGPTSLAAYTPDNTTAGANGRISQYPLACVTGGPALAWGVPLSQPRIFRLGCSPATGQAYAVFDLGLSRRVRKSPGCAGFSLVLYRPDPAWGFRGALKRYYDLFPEEFRARMKEPGGWVCWGNLKTIPNIQGYGFRYHWGPPTAEPVAEDNRLGIPAFLYNDSVRYYCDLGEFDAQPADDRVRSILQAFLHNPDPLAVWLSAPEAGETAQDETHVQEHLTDFGREAAGAWVRRGQAAVRASAMRDEQGRIAVGYVVHYEGAFPPRWWTGRVSCNLDPDIPGGFGQFQLREVIGATFDHWRTKGARLSGVGLDNYYVDANRLDYARDHLAYADVPACFTRDGQRVVLLGAFETYEWTLSLARWLRANGHYLMNNACVLPYAFDVPLMDVLGFEWNLEAQAAAARALCYHKPLVSLPVAGEHWQAPWIERCHVRFAALPGGSAGCDAPARRAVYQRYVPALLEMARAGWEPVTHARSSAPGVFVERFGGESASGPLLLSVTNTTAGRRAAKVTLDPGLASGLPATVPDLIRGGAIPVRRRAGRWTLDVTLAPRQAMALRLRQ